MHQLPTIIENPTTLPATIVEAEFAAARNFADNEKAAASRKAYASDWRIFATWCTARALDPLPATPQAICAFVASQAQEGAKTSTLTRRLAAIRYAHKLTGHEPPTSAEVVKATMRGVRRTIGTAPAKKAPATADLVQKMLATCGDDLRGLRDRAIVAFGFASAMRRSELVALRVEDLTETADGYQVLIRHSKTDQERQGQTVAVPAGSRLRPVEAVSQWLAGAGITSGPIFRAVGAQGAIAEAQMTARMIAARVKRSAKLAGLDPSIFAGHSLRAGFITSAAKSGASIFKLADQSRHRSMDTLRGYVRDAQLVDDHAGAAFL